MSAKDPIGILGGTFDPVHNGHLTIAEKALAALRLQAVIFIPNKTPPHRHKPIASPEHRLAMAEIAAESNVKFMASDIEITREGPSYTIDTVKALHADFPQAPLCLILGSDAFADFNTWEQWEQILDYAHLIVVNRERHPELTDWQKPFVKPRECKDILELRNTPSGKIFFLHITPIPFAAHRVREKLASGDDIQDDVPIAVCNYIRYHQPYRA